MENDRFLSELAVEMGDLFETQRRDTGRAYGDRNDICRLTKEGIAAIATNDWRTVAECWKQVVELRHDLTETVEIPDPLRSQLLDDVDKEIVEFLFVQEAFPYLRGDKDVMDWSDLHYQHLVLLLEDEPDGIIHVPPQLWLSGIFDGISEVSKQLRAQLVDDEIDTQNQLDIWLKALTFFREMHGFLNQFCSVVGGVIDGHLSGRRLWKKTFRGQIALLQHNIIDEYMRDISQLRRELRLLKVMENRKS